MKFRPDSVEQPLLHPTALEQTLLKERVVCQECLRIRAGLGLEGNQASRSIGKGSSQIRRQPQLGSHYVQRSQRRCEDPASSHQAHKPFRDFPQVWGGDPMGVNDLLPTTSLLMSQTASLSRLGFQRQTLESGG